MESLLTHVSSGSRVAEVVWSDDVQVQMVECIEGPCRVLPLPEYKLRLYLDASGGPSAKAGERGNSRGADPIPMVDTFFYNLAYNKTIDCLFPLADVDLDTCFPWLPCPERAPAAQPQQKQHRVTASWERFKQQVMHTRRTRAFPAASRSPLSAHTCTPARTNTPAGKLMSVFI